MRLRFLLKFPHKTVVRRFSIVDPGKSNMTKTEINKLDEITEAIKRQGYFSMNTQRGLLVIFAKWLFYGFLWVVAFVFLTNSEIRKGPENDKRYFLVSNYLATALVDVYEKNFFELHKDMIMTDDDLKLLKEPIETLASQVSSKDSQIECRPQRL